MKHNLRIICRGGGDLATGIIHRLYKSGFPVLVLETDKPAAIRRQVSFCEAVYDGACTIEGVTAQLIESIEQAEAVMKEGKVPVLVDPEGDSIKAYRPDVLIDAIIAKRNLGTQISMASLVIGVGPGFCAGEDVHLVIETMRGHNLGRIIEKGCALANTGVPGNIGGFAAERVIHAAEAGIIEDIRRIGDVVEAGEEIARIYMNGSKADYVTVTATIPGIIRGLIRSGYQVTRGFKIADIDPRPGELSNCFTISDKSRAIGGSVLEAVCRYANNRE